MKKKKQHQSLTEEELKAIAKKVDEDIIKDTINFLEKKKAERIAWRKDGCKDL
jgi:hypothetical protein